MIDLLGVNPIMCPEQQLKEVILFFEKSYPCKLIVIYLLNWTDWLSPFDVTLLPAFSGLRRIVRELEALSCRSAVLKAGLKSGRSKISQLILGGRLSLIYSNIVLKILYAHLYYFVGKRQ